VTIARPRRPGGAGHRIQQGFKICDFLVEAAAMHDRMIGRLIPGSVRFGIRDIQSV